VPLKCDGLRPIIASVTSEPYAGQTLLETRLADALLIAAAPELLKALKAAKDALISYQYGNSSPELAEEIVTYAVAVIARAEPGIGLNAQPARS